MMLPVRVLPSNAPPLGDEGHVQLASRVLQEQSGNRQQNDFITAAGFQPKYAAPSSSLTENTWPNYHAQYAPQLYHPQPQYRQPWRYGGQYSGHQQAHEKDRLELRGEALIKRFKMCEGYKKYRERQANNRAAGKAQKWPDDVEEAFLKALVKYPPVGRRQSLLNGKRCGRNELIADYMYEKTGNNRFRKQVSSHIQVLRPFVAHDPQILQYLSTPKDSTHPNGQHGGMGGRRASNYPVIAPPNQVQSGQQLALPSLELSKLRNVKHGLDVFQPTNFEMFVQRKYKLGNDEQADRLHTYTQSIQAPLGPDLAVHDWQALAQSHPFLAAMHKQRPLDCNVLLADASMAFPLDTFKDQDGSALPGIELGISLTCSSRHLCKDAIVKCHNSFYRNGDILREHSGPFDVSFVQGEDRSSVETQLKFGSTFWARTLAHLAARLRDVPDAAREHKEDVPGILQSINAIQEVVALSDSGHERILVIFWTFRHSRSVKGRTSWRKLVLPRTATSAHNQSHQVELARDERVDSVFDYSVAMTDSSATHQDHSQPELQSPFEYDGSQGSALSSATWAPNLSEGDASALSAPDFATNNNYDFTGGNINIHMPYDPSFDLTNFDSSAAFSFDTAAVDFATDPALQQYSQEWCDNFAHSFDASTAGVEDAYAVPAAHMAVEQHSFEGAATFDGQEQEYLGYEVPYSQSQYADVQEQQAYGGAGSDGLKGADALATLADASFLAVGM